MYNCNNPNRSKLIHAAQQELPCSLTIENVNYVNMFTGEIYKANVDVLGEYVVNVRMEGEPTELPSEDVYDGNGAYLIPGFIDAHMHVESTMLIPENLSRAIVPWGTTTIFTDPHEIANVMGIPGIQFMLENSRKSALRQYVLAPSCVPSAPDVEHAGAVFGADEIASILDIENVVGIAELMDFKGVFTDSPRMHAIIEEGLKRSAYLQGHAPGLSGKTLAAYRLGGPESDHESYTGEEAMEKLRMGMRINLRTSSLVDTLDSLVSGIQNSRWFDFISVCTDDVHAKDLLSVGHVNHVVGNIIRAGIPSVDAIRMATLNAAREFGFKNMGAIAPGYLADMQLVDALDGRAPTAVWIGGRLVAEAGRYVALDDHLPSSCPPSPFNAPSIASPADFFLRVPEEYHDFVEVNVITPQNDDRILYCSEWLLLPVQNGIVDLKELPDLQYFSACNRYGLATKTVAAMKDFGLIRGAIAATVSHDCHNFVSVYKNPNDAYLAFETLKNAGGGICVVENGQVTGLLRLPVAGLMSLASCGSLAAEIEQVTRAMNAISTRPLHLLQLSVLSLPCLPGIVVTDVGLVDGISQAILPMFR